MSTLQIEERIAVGAPPARVWKFLLDPARVAACLPGARLDGTEGDKTFLGTMKVKVGPVLMEFKGKATMSEVVPEERRVTLTGTGNDKSGGGSAKMDMKSQILARDGGGSEILVIADVDLAGKLVRFGRGMMEGISKQLFKQFSERVRAELESEEDDEEEEEQPQEEQPATQVSPDPEHAGLALRTGGLAPPVPPRIEPMPPTEAAPVDTPHPETAPLAATPAGEPPPAEAPAASIPETAPLPAQPPPAEDIPATVASPAAGEPAEAAAPATEEVPSTQPASSPPTVPPTEAAPAKEEAAEPAAAKPPPAAKAAAPGASAAPPRKKKASPKKAALAPADNAPLDAGSLVWAAIWAWIKGLFARVFGKKS